MGFGKCSFCAEWRVDGVRNVINNLQIQDQTVSGAAAR